jgi:putative radical SAM enzyme (TIGR03279 family)
MNAVIKSITPGSPASRTTITPGDVLRKINGNIIGDVLDYRFFSYDSRLLIELHGKTGRIKLVKLRKPEGADVGLEFDTFLMDKERSCANKCIFCFIDQLPEGMRETLYYKDDDVRLSFLQGNYITLTNLMRHDVERIIKQRISPINVSVHTLDPVLRAFMTGAKSGSAGTGTIEALAEAGIQLNCQIVCCPGINDGEELSKTLDGLMKLGSSINSVSVVPVGLTKHRRGLTELQPYDEALALQTIKLVDGFGETNLKRVGSRCFFCADELYLMAGLELPPHEFYEDYPQLENGVGMMRLFITEFEEALDSARERASFQAKEPSPCLLYSLVTGTLAAEKLTNLLKTVSEKYGTIMGDVHGIRNEFFGESVTVSGLVTGGDIITQLKGKELGSRLLIPQNMLRYGENIFLDDITVDEVSEALGVPIRIVKQNGADLVNAILGK